MDLMMEGWGVSENDVRSDGGVSSLAYAIVTRRSNTKPLRKVLVSSFVRSFVRPSVVYR